jgi:hypothetical protein
MWLGDWIAWFPWIIAYLVSKGSCGPRVLTWDPGVTAFPANGRKIQVSDEARQRSLPHIVQTLDQLVHPFWICTRRHHRSFQRTNKRALGHSKHYIIYPHLVDSTYLDVENSFGIISHTRQCMASCLFQVMS